MPTEINPRVCTLLPTHDPSKELNETTCCVYAPYYFIPRAVCMRHIISCFHLPTTKVASVRVHDSVSNSPSTFRIAVILIYRIFLFSLAGLGGGAGRGGARLALFPDWVDHQPLAIKVGSPSHGRINEDNETKNRYKNCNNSEQKLNK